MSQYRRILIPCAYFFGAIAVLLLVGFAIKGLLEVERLGSSEALAAEDRTKEIMATSIVDAKELWVSAMAVNKIDDGDDIAIAIIASKLFEMRYLQTYIE